MSDSQAFLEHLDQLMVKLARALSDQNWDELARLNAEVKPAVEPLMTAMAAGEVDAEPVRTRLEELQQLVEAANRAASQARQEAQAALKGVNENRHAAKAYQNISSNRPK